MQKSLESRTLGALWYLDCRFHRHIATIDSRRTEAHLSGKLRRMLLLCMVHEIQTPNVSAESARTLATRLVLDASPQHLSHKL